MAAARLLVATDDHGIRGVHEEHLIGQVVAIHLIEHLHERIEELPAACIDDEHDLAHMTARMTAKLHEFRDKDRRQVVDDEIAEILHIAAGLRLAPSRHARYDDQTEILLFFLGNHGVFCILLHSFCLLKSRFRCEND